MKVKHIKPRTTIIKKLKPGDSFEAAPGASVFHNDPTYMKIYADPTYLADADAGNLCYAVDLESGKVVLFPDNAPVLKLDMVVIHEVSIKEA